MQELRDSCCEIEDRTVDVELVHVAGNRTGQQALLQRQFRRLERKAARAVSDIEVDARGDLLQHLVVDTALRVEDASFAPAEAVGDHVSRLHQVENIGDRGMRPPDVDHDGKPGRIGCRAGAPQHLEIVFPRDVAGQAHLHPDDDVAVPFQRLRREIDIGVSQGRAVPPTDCLVRGSIWPTTEIFKRAMMGVSATSMTYFRSPGKVCAPDEPASIAVVTPLAMQLGSAGIPRGATPS